MNLEFSGQNIICQSAVQVSGYLCDIFLVEVRTPPGSTGIFTSKLQGLHDIPSSKSET